MDFDIASRYLIQQKINCVRILLGSWHLKFKNFAELFHETIVQLLGYARTSDKLTFSLASIKISISSSSTNAIYYKYKYWSDRFVTSARMATVTFFFLFLSLSYFFTAIPEDTIQIIKKISSNLLWSIIIT